MKLEFEQSEGWQASLVDENGKEIEIKDESWDVMVRPDYLEVEAKINKVLPEPLWMRKSEIACILCLDAL